MAVAALVALAGLVISGGVSTALLWPVPGAIAGMLKTLAAGFCIAGATAAVAARTSDTVWSKWRYMGLEIAVVVLVLVMMTAYYFSSVP